MYVLRLSDMYVAEVWFPSESPHHRRKFGGTYFEEKPFAAIW